MLLSRRNFIVSSIGLCACLASLKRQAFASVTNRRGLKDLFASDFKIGALIEPEVYMRDGAHYAELIPREFNALVANNTFKWANIHPTAKHWDWSYGDQFVNFGEQLAMYLVGHVLIWSSQNPPSLFLGEDGELINGGKLLSKMESHIANVVDRYKGRIHAWDVVNEAVNEKGWVSNGWYRSMGADYIARAYQVAREADPHAVLLYNDYNLSIPERRVQVLDLIDYLRNKQAPIDAIGLQGHFTLNFPDLSAFEESIVAFSEKGLRIHISELDVDVLPGLGVDQYPDYDSKLDPYREGLPVSISGQLADRYKSIFEVLLKHSDKIDRVNFWGISDTDSWKNDFPIEGRVNYPLLFDRNGNKKSAYRTVAQLKT